jgi:hypothetical protein
MAMTLMEAHQRVLGRASSADQDKLYTSWPEFRGFSDRTADVVRAEAVILAALMSGIGTDRVLILVSRDQEEWLLKQCEAAAIACFEGCKKYPSRVKELVYGYTRLFQKLKMTGRLLQLQEEPPHWVSFGFTVDDPLPAWMTNRLLLSTQ